MGATPELPNLNLDPASEYRAWQALSVYFTVLLNRQIRRRWQLEHECMQDRPVAQWFRPVIFLEPVPQLHRPQLPTVCPLTMANLKTKVHLLRGRVEKGKELASQIERRMLDSKVDFPTHFCHTCVVGCESESEILLTKCGHRVCRTCLSFGVDECGVYECSICFVPTSFVAKSPLSIPRRAKSEELAPVGHKDGQKRVSFGTFD
ncbi:uncharacterized protein N7503_004156 [Penicillium pulvis]|uniref:uncharacterized protein n=1 Tax=Penicillium pulvis TaxID=1562058 RepID=UPI002548496A|nr:uncharacterized protein N7503_004156 [Penicillium pulvis]KAJ5806554.1 hypothetical protein N7503_004156 [Penicillium pulvis]